MPRVNVIKRGNVVRHEGQPCLVLECAIRTPPNMASYCQMSIRNVSTGKIGNLRLPVSAEFEVLENQVRKLEYSYEADGVYTFTDPETFETYDLDKELVEDSKGFLVMNQSYDIMFVEEKPLVVTLPASLEMTVIEAADAVKGDSSGSVTKPVTLETGIIVNVPLFIKQGEKIRVRTEDKTYLGRA